MEIGPRRKLQLYGLIVLVMVVAPLVLWGRSRMNLPTTMDVPVPASLTTPPQGSQSAIFGWRMLTGESTLPPDALSESYRQQLQQAGWEARASRIPGSAQWEREGRSLSFHAAPLQGGHSQWSVMIASH